MDSCPSCGRSFQADPIPEGSREHYGGKTHFSHLICVEVRGLYDGGAYNLCPFCEYKWGRFPTGTYPRIDRYLEQEGIDSLEVMRAKMLDAGRFETR